MNVYIANFGYKNYEWPRCYEWNTIATMNDAGAHVFWESNDREGYINYCIKNVKTITGITPPTTVASRWFNLMSIIYNSSNDIWIHKQGDDIWWTISTDQKPEIFKDKEPDGTEVYICHKPCREWSNKDGMGRKLSWRALHPKAQDFLATEATLQKLTEDNAAYAKSLVFGEDLSWWHGRPHWKQKQEKSKRKPGHIYNNLEVTIWRMAQTARETAENSKKAARMTNLKEKEIRFKGQQLERYLHALLSEQGGVCALTGIPLVLDREDDDKELRCSLDRIDSNGHYEEGNLQIVCRFVNRWKSDDEDEEFRRLIRMVQEQKTY